MKTRTQTLLLVFMMGALGAATASAGAPLLSPRAQSHVSRTALGSTPDLIKRSDLPASPRGRLAVASLKKAPGSEGDRLDRSVVPMSPRARALARP